MKKSDIAVLILVATLAVFAAFAIGNTIPFLKPPKDSVKVKTVDPIKADVSEPNKQVFNDDAINPTVEVVVGGS